MPLKSSNESAKGEKQKADVNNTGSKTLNKGFAHILWGKRYIQGHTLCFNDKCIS